MAKAKHPMQPVERYDSAIRFKRNPIVCLLLDDGKYDMNRLALLNFDDADREQFAQLIGYSVGGFCDLSYVSDEASVAATRAARELAPRSARTRKVSR